MDILYEMQDGKSSSACIVNFPEAILNQREPIFIKRPMLVWCRHLENTQHINHNFYKKSFTSYHIIINLLYNITSFSLIKVHWLSISKILFFIIIDLECHIFKFLRLHFYFSLKSVFTLDFAPDYDTCSFLVFRYKK